MPWWRESDTFADDPMWEVLAAGKQAMIDALKASACNLKSKTAHQLDHGYLTAATALGACAGRQKVLDLLCTAVLDRKPLVHRRGDECDCLGDTWVDGFSYRVHDFLKGNPTRLEYHRHRAQSADRRDQRLRQLVKTRDGLFCRYCRSGPLSNKAGRAKDRRKFLHYDHIDPDQPAGPDGENYVVACARCNEHKGNCTPDEADMTLLPVPTPHELADWNRRGLALFDRPPYDPNHQPITDEPPTEHRQSTDTNTDPVGDPDPGRQPDPHDDSPPSVHHKHDDDGTDQQPNPSPDPPGSGRVGPPADRGDPGRAQPVRTSAHPDVYHRRSRGSTFPDQLWPQGASPVRPPASADPGGGTP